MRTAQSGDTVFIHYIGILDNGRIFDSTTDDAPLRFTIGKNEIFPALEREIIGMRPGEARNILIAAADAYGPRRGENMLTLGRDSFPKDRPIAVGRKLRIEFNGRVERVMLVVEVTDAHVVLDGNHPLAGYDLTFALRLDRIENA
jgi:FKBP-type peptidyl-prolyl cis-trans isomerase 2